MRSRIYDLLVAIFVAGLSPSMALAANGTFTASSQCVGTGITFTLHNNSPITSIRLHDKMLVVFNQSTQIVYQPSPGPLVLVAKWSQPPNLRTWGWDQKTSASAQAPVGTYTVVLAVDDDSWDPYVSNPTPLFYTATFKILPPSPGC
jgi:hypothetical protein